MEGTEADPTLTFTTTLLVSMGFSVAFLIVTVNLTEGPATSPGPCASPWTASSSEIFAVTPVDIETLVPGLTGCDTGWATVASWAEFSAPRLGTSADAPTVWLLLGLGLGAAGDPDGTPTLVADFVD